jgi:hypothetical protein
MSSEAPKKRGRRRGTGWTDEETEALLDIWNDMNVEQYLEDLKSNNTAIYTEISKELYDRKFAKTADLCKTRMHTLRRNFRLTKTSLRSRRTVCKFYDKLNEVLGTKPASSPVKIIEPMNKKGKR